MANLDPGVIESVINSNFKSLAERVAVNAVSHDHRLDILAEKSLARSLDAMQMLDVSEGLGIAAANRSDLAKQVSDLSASIAGIQQMMKGAQTTPRETAND